MRNSKDYFRRVEARALVRELALVLQVVEKLASFRSMRDIFLIRNDSRTIYEIHDEIKLVWRLKRPVHLHQEWMLNARQDALLRQCVFHLTYKTSNI